MTKKKASTTARIARIHRVKLTPIAKLERIIDELHEPKEVEEETNEKLCEYAVDLQTSPGMQLSFRHIIEEIQDNHRPQIPKDRQFEIAEASLSLLIADVCLAERMRASR
jgi:hypothetical protein